MAEQVVSECDHGFPRDASGVTAAIQHYTPACSHIGNRFVVVIANPKTKHAFVDFVQLAPFLCESRYVTFKEILPAFEYYDARLRAGISPNPDLSD